MSALQKATFTVASSDVSTYKQVCGPGNMAARFFVNGDASSGNPVIEMALVDVDGSSTVVLGRYPATCTVSSRRAAAGGASGAYICVVVFTEGGTSKFDLLGHGGGDGGVNARWYVGCTSLGSGSQASVDVYWEVDDEI